MSRRRVIGILVPLAAAAALAGCGGGGGGDTGASGDPTASSGAVFTPQGVSADQAAAQAAAALGSPGSVDPARVGETLAGHDDFSTPRDVFEAQVSDTTGSGTSNGAEDPAAGGGTAIPVVSPTTTIPPSVSVGGAGTTTTGGGTTTTGGAPAPAAPSTPVTSVKTLEADFDISGEPVVAREGDAIPPDTQQFTVKTIGASSVVLQLNAGLLPDGSDTVTLDEGESLTLYNQTARQG
ncbi:MAG: hypothetical protein AB1416_14010, partial [Actinomycetota bacterium]